MNRRSGRSLRASANALRRRSSSPFRVEPATTTFSPSPSPRLRLKSRSSPSEKTGSRTSDFRLPATSSFAGSIPSRSSLSRSSSVWTRKRVDVPEDAPGDRPDVLVDLEGMLGDPPVDQEDLQPTVGRLADEVRPELGFRQDKGAGAHGPEDPVDDAPEIEGDEEDPVRLDELFPGHLDPGMGERGEDDVPLGMPALELPDEVLERNDLAHRDRVDPDRFPALRPALQAQGEALAEMDAVLFQDLHPERIEGEIEGERNGQGERIDQVHGP